MKTFPFCGRTFAVLGILCLLAGTIHAATLTITNGEDDGPGSLRQAVANAVNGDEIRFDLVMSGVPVHLTSDEIIIDKDLTILGLGKDLTTITSAIQNRIFTIAAGISVSVDGLRLMGIFRGIYNFTPGGAILNRGNLTLSNSKLERNDGGGEGAGIFNDGGDLTLIDTDFVDNSVDGFGGGLSNSSSGRVQMSRCVFESNWARSSGGAIVNGGHIVADSCIFRNNRAHYYGGAIVNGGSVYLNRSAIESNLTTYGAAGVRNGGLLVVTESTIAGNDCPDNRAGGIINDGDALVTNSTIYGNRGISVGGVYNGGAYRRANLVVDSSTVTGNTSTGPSTGDGIYNDAGYDGVVVRNSMIIGNYGRYVVTANDCDGSFVSMGNNIVGSVWGTDLNGTESTVCHGFDQGVQGDLVGLGVEQVLESEEQRYYSGKTFMQAVLADNGGPTPTVALIPGSPAIDYIPLSECTDSEDHSILTDQRGTPRPQGTACDVGAFEFSYPRSLTYWAQQCQEKGDRDYTGDELQDLLSQVKGKYASTAACVPVDCYLLTLGQPTESLQTQAEAELLASWLNLASGKLTQGRPVTLGRLSEAATVGAALSEVAGTVCDPGAGGKEFLTARDIARALNGSEKE